MWDVYNDDDEDEHDFDITIFDEISPLMSLEQVSLDSLSNDLSKKMLPPMVQAPKLELKELPQHLKYAYLGELETLPIIISKDLTLEQERKLMEVLKEHKLAIG